MGNTSAKPSVYVSKQWIDDRDSNTCHMCCKHFGATRRRHHCRCCGEIFCAECWGKETELPADYGYEHKVPVCIACECLFSGKLRYLRMPRRIVLTRALKTNKAMEKPPLCAELASKRAFEVFFTKLAHWRPLNDHTHLIFAVTLRTANNQNSSHFNTVAANSPHRTATSSTGIPKASALDLNLLRSTSQWSDNSGDNSTLRQAKSEDFTQNLSKQSHNENTTSTKHTVGDVQLDVAWILPLDSILSVHLDAHPEGDYISVETHAEVYRIQVADAVGAVTAERESGAGSFQIGAGKTKPVALGDEHKDKATPSALSSSYSRRAALSSSASAPLFVQSDDSKSKSVPNRKRVSMRDDQEGARTAVTQKLLVASNNEKSSRLSNDDDDDEDIITSKPRKNVTFVYLAEETCGLFMELQEALRLMEKRSAQRTRREGK